MYRLALLLPLLFVMFPPASPVIATPVVHNESRLAVYTHGFRVGEIISRYSRSDEAGHDVVLYTSHTRIDADLLVTSYTMEGDEEARIGSQGTRSYHKVWRENGEHYQVEGRLEGGTFRCIKTGPGGAARTSSFPRFSYDYTTMDCPELRIKEEGESLTVRMLDLEACEVVTRCYRWVKTERLTVNGVADLFRVIEFRDRKNLTIRWILPDTVGVRIARQDGKSRNGTYSVRAVDPAR